MPESVHFLCPYCGRDTTGNSEHIIPHAIGGALKPYNVCCKKCNNKLGEIIDAPFVRMFNAIRAKMGKLNGCDQFSGPYPVVIESSAGRSPIYRGTVNKGRISCAELSRELKCSCQELKLSEDNIVGLRFSWDNQVFLNGFSKIAYEFALCNGLSACQLKHCVHTDTSEEGDLTNVRYSFKVVPFFPLNYFDEFVEMETICRPYHHLLLFVQRMQLWCYVDLFNTFQFYVLLSDSFSGEMSAVEHFQFVESMDRSIPELPCDRSPKDAQIDAMTYGVKPTLDANLLNRRIENAIQTKSVATSSESLLRGRLCEFVNHIKSDTYHNHKTVMSAVRNVELYFNGDDLCLDAYRQKFVAEDGSCRSYPNSLFELYAASRDRVNEYGHKKFYRLFNYNFAGENIVVLV